MRRILLAGLLFAIASCGGDAGTDATVAPTPPVQARPTTIGITGAGEFTASASQMVPIVVHVASSAGGGFANLSVALAATSGSLSSATVTTDFQGNATASWNVGTVFGNQTLTATIPGTSLVAQVTAAVTPPAVAQLLVSPPTRAVAVASQPTSVVFSATTDQGLRAVGATVNFSATGGTFSPAAAVVDTNGFASTSWTPPSTFGAQTVTASSGNATQSLPIYISSALPASLTISYNGPTIALAGTSISPLPVATVLDANGVAVQGASVAFRASSGTLSGPNPTYTDAQGHASPTTWTLSASAGSQVFTASAAGLSATPSITVSAVTGGSITIAVASDLPVGSYMDGTIAGPPGFTTQPFSILEPGTQLVATTDFGKNFSLPFGTYTVAWNDAIGGNPAHLYAPGQAVQTYVLSPTSLTATVQTTWTVRH